MNCKTCGAPTRVGFVGCRYCGSQYSVYVEAARPFTPSPNSVITSIVKLALCKGNHAEVIEISSALNLGKISHATAVSRLARLL